MVNRSATALLVKTIATANEVIVGKETETGKEIGTGIAEGEIARTATATPTGATAKGTVIAIATGTVNVLATGRKDARAMRKNAGESRVKTTAGVHRATRRAAPRAVRAAVAVASVMAVRLIVALPHPWVPSCSRSASARQAVGTSMLRATSSTRLCRQSKPVRTALARNGT
jgi:hypothetical protein